MPSINKSDYWKDRKGSGGKGDLHQNGLPEYRDAELWGRSDCCNAPILKFNNRSYCEKCGEPCSKA